MLRMVRDLQKGKRKTVCSSKALKLLRGIRQIQAFENATLDVLPGVDNLNPPGSSIDTAIRIARVQSIS